MIDASGVGAVIDLAAIPCAPALTAKLSGVEHALAVQCLLAGGDDYELCFTAAPTQSARITAIADALDLPLARIGSIAAVGGLVVRDEWGTPMTLPPAFDHFAPDAG